MTQTQTRPVFNRLPIKGYQDNPLVDWLLQAYDDKLVAVGQQVEQLHKKLDPATTDPEYLDWLAAMVGMVDPYYDPSWPVAVKRLAVAKANEIFSLRGTLAGLKLALDIHSIPYQINASSDLRLPFKLPAVFGTTNSTVFVILPLSIPRTSRPFIEAKKAISNYTSINTPVRACYDKFYVGFSQIGDPLFS